MPCNAGPSMSDVLEEERQVDLLVQMLCAVSRRLGQNAFDCHPSLAQWFQEHEKTDRRRLADIIERQGIEALTDADRSVLIDILLRKSG